MIAHTDNLIPTYSTIVNYNADIILTGELLVV